jgi:aminoglycoside phosphotransferase (APT) family kinase protein/SAM-dependent methyltransferase
MLPSVETEGAGLLACPICHGPLSVGEERMHCDLCAVGYANACGVVLAGPPFAGDVMEEGRDGVFAGRMRRLAADAARHGWETAQAQFASDVLVGRLPAPATSRWTRVQAKASGGTWEDTLQDLTDSACAGWKFLVDLRRTSRVCFLGPSWGAAPLSLAQSCAHVAVFDGSTTRLELTRQQALGMHLDNLTFARVSDPLCLPLADQSVDLVVVPGLLGWFETVGATRPIPATCEADFLKEIRRVLAPGGQIYLGTDNRYSVARLLRGARSKPGMLTAPLLQSAAAEAGFADCRVLSPFPFRHKFHQILDVGHTNGMNFCADPYRTRGRLLRPLVKLWDRWNRDGGVERRLYPYLPALSAVLTSDRPGGSFAERLLEKIGSEAGLQPSGYRLARYYVRPKGAVVLVGGDPATGGVIVRAPLNASAEESCARQHAAIEAFARDERLSAPLHALFPAPIAQGHLEEQPFFAENAVSGEVGRLYYSRPERRFDRAIQNAAEVLRQLRRATEEPVLIDEAEFNRHCGDWLTELRGVVSTESHEALDLIERVLRNALEGVTLPLGWYHGDYDFANLLYGPDDAVTGILDFEVFEPKGLPLIDFMVLLARRPIRRRGFAFGTLFVRAIFERKLPPLEAELLEREMRTLGIDEPLYRALALCCWLNHLRLRRDSWLVRSQSWLDENLHAVIDSVRRIL